MRTYPDGLKQAILAMSFFNSRHGVRKRYKKPTRPSHVNETVPLFHEHVRIARHYISEARKHGFRGSVYAAVMERGRS